ncbi:pilin [candidate division KSB1 bacterium]
MSKIIRFLSLVFVLFLLQVSLLGLSVQNVSGNEVQLSAPVGGDILPGGQMYQDDIKTSFIFSRLIPFVIKYTISLAVALAVIALIIGGYQFMTAYGDTEKHQKAQKTITYAIIGLVLAIAAFGIVRIVTTINFT